MSHRAARRASQVTRCGVWLSLLAMLAAVHGARAEVEIDPALERALEQAATAELIPGIVFRHAQVPASTIERRA
ncbi:MAG: hypothetical protein JSV80_01760, partial [Acidobacteriota bacterium]